MMNGNVHMAGGGNNAYFADSLDEFEELARGILEGGLPSLVERGYESVSEKSIDKTGRLLAKAYERAIQLCGQRASDKNT